MRTTRKQNSVGLVLLVSALATWMFSTTFFTSRRLFEGSARQQHQQSADRSLLSPWIFQPTMKSEQSPPPIIYRIQSSENSNSATTRSTSSTITKRTTSHVTTYQVTQWLQNGHLAVVPSNTTSTTNGISNVITFKKKQVLADTLSHLVAIEQAYSAGHETVLIVDDSDVLFQNNGQRNAIDWNDLWDHVHQAPSEWNALQLVTQSRMVQRHLNNLNERQDHWISWQADHGGAKQAYLLSRNGMRQILSRTHSLGKDNGRSVWRLPEPSMISANEVIFFEAKNAYTSTFDWSSSQDYRPKQTATRRLESILILMSVRIKSVEDMATELDRIRQDHSALCSLHQAGKCDWAISIVLVEESLLDAWNKTLLKESASWTDQKVQFKVQVAAERFNKFTFVAEYTDRMPAYDFVLLKDNDQRLAGFPWNTFMEQKDTAIVSGPLRQEIEEGLERSVGLPHFPLHHGPEWKQDASLSAGSLSAMYTSIRPLSIPMVEMYFVLLRGDFSQWFFSQILTPDFVDQPLAWGPDFMWCAAANDFRPDAPSCLLVPVISAHEDTRQISKGHDFQLAGNAVLQRFREIPTFDRWLARSYAKWRQIIKEEASLKKIKRRCKGFFDTKSFDMQECATKAFQ
jgi:hypothetical protein